VTTEKFTLRCSNCGSTKFRAATAKPGPDDPVTCAACGAVVRLGDLKARLEEEARKAVEDRLRGRLKPE
jgi:uncharacterized Zn finger protein